MTGRTFTLSIPAPAGWLSSNHRRDRRAETGDRQAWREAAGWRARQAKLPKLERIHIVAWLSFGDKRRRDAHNYMPTLKAIVDGLVDVGVLPDDDDKHLTGPDLRRAPDDGTGCARAVTLSIEEVC